METQADPATSPSPAPGPNSPKPRAARLRREARLRRRRLAFLAIGVIVVLVAGVVVLSSGDDKPGLATRRSSTTSPPSSAKVGPTSTTAAPKPSTTVSSKGTPGPTTVAVALPQADSSAPPDPPVGLYKRGRLFLEGSVPTEAAAAGYLRKIRAILGTKNVVMGMKRDGRVPASPMQVIVEEQFQFPTGSFRVDPKYTALLNLGIYALKKLPEAKLVITGYTDSRGPAAVNQSLSEQRAQVVVDWMVKGGIPARRVVALGRGPADPIADNATEAGRQKNRRIEATLDGVTPT